MLFSKKERETTTTGRTNKNRKLGLHFFSFYKEIVERQTSHL